MSAGASLLALLRCPQCRADLTSDGDELTCARCAARHPIRDGIAILLPPDSPLAAEAEPFRPRGKLRSSHSADQRDYWETDDLHRPVHHPIVEGFARQRWDHIRSVIPLEEVESALDVGCGSGFSTVYAPKEIRMVACDGSMHMLRRHPGRDKVMVDAMHLPFADETFDMVFCWELLHHVAEPWRAVAELARVSRKWVLLFEPNPYNLAQFLFALYDPEHRWVLRFTKGYFTRQMVQAGVTPEVFQRVGLIFPNKTPPWLYPWLRALPFRIPFIGISQLLVGSKLSAR